MVREGVVQRAELRTLRRRAYDELDLAIDQSGGELPHDWLSKGDRDLEPLRRVDEPGWHLLVLRATGHAEKRYPQFPRAAWGDPHRRRDEWFGVAVILVVLAAAVVLAFLPIEALLVLAALGVIGGVALIWALARQRELILGAIVLFAAIVVLLILLPAWAVAALALLVASAGAVAMGVERQRRQSPPTPGRSRCGRSAAGSPPTLPR